MDSNKLPVAVDEVNQPSGSSSAMSRKGACAAVSYMATAVLLVMFNKAALSSYGFPHANVITLLQMISSCLLLYAMRSWKVISFKTGESPSTNSNSVMLITSETLIQTLPLAISYLFYLLVTMESIRVINVPMYTTLRKTTAAFTMIVEYLLTGKKHSLPVVGRVQSGYANAFHMAKTKSFISVGIVILGAFIAGARDLSFDAYGYAVVFIANACTAIYLASISRIGKSSGLNSFGLMWSNGIICGPILLIWTSFNGDLTTMMNFPYILYPGFQAVLLLSCILAFLINYFVFLSTTLNSALTHTICGNLKDLLTIGLGWFLFGGLPYDPLNVVGQSLSFFGSCLYAYLKLRGK